MRGHLSGHRCALPTPSRQQAGGADSALPHVLSDFDHDLPVGAAELDAIESFLMPLINELLGEGKTIQDSEAPQSCGMKKVQNVHPGALP